MSIVARFPPGGTTQQYDEIVQRIQQSDQWPPDGLEFHVAFGPSDNVHVSEVWDSREQMDAFGEYLIPLLQEAGIPLEGEPEVFEVHNIFKRWVDALWAGLPVVASRVGGVPEIVRDGETEILVPPGDPRALATALNRVLGDEALAQRPRANARRERDRWGGLVERTLAVYDEIRRRSSPRSASASTAVLSVEQHHGLVALSRPGGGSPSIWRLTRATASSAPAISSRLRVRAAGVERAFSLRQICLLFQPRGPPPGWKCTTSCCPGGCFCLPPCGTNSSFGTIGAFHAAAGQTTAG